MFNQMPPFFNWPNQTSGAPEQAPSDMFAGMPMVNPLLNDAQQNIESLDERIAQLESVAQWLNMNLQMVNSGVQQLQVQKQTLLALAQWQEMSANAMSGFANAGAFGQTAEATDGADNATEATQTDPQSATSDNAAPADASAMPAAFEQMAQSWWTGLQNQFGQLAKSVFDDAAVAADATDPPKSTTAKAKAAATAKPKAKPATRKKPAA